MGKFFLTFIFVFMTTLSVFAFEDYVIITDGKMTNINIEDDTVIDILPLVTIMNEKDTLIVTALKCGSTNFSVLKDGKDRVMFHADINENETKISSADGFEIVRFDNPPAMYEVEIDAPPLSSEGEE